MTYQPMCQFERADHLAKDHYPDGAWQCVKCGAVRPSDSQEYCNQFGWGDRVEQITSTLGIKKCGGCARRQKRMNKWGLKK